MTAGVITLIVFVGVLVLTLIAIGVHAWLSDPGAVEQLARAERDLHARRRSREAAEMKQQIRADGRALRREVQQELRRRRWSSP